MSEEGTYALVLRPGASTETGGTAVCGFSNVGMVGVIAAGHLVRTLELEQRATVLDASFPPMALIKDEVPRHPVRVYGGEDLGVFTSEIPFSESHDLLFAKTVLEWYTKGGFDRLIIIDGLVRQSSEPSQGGLFGVGSTAEARQALSSSHPVHHARRGGRHPPVPALGGDRLGLDIVAALAECNPMYPDARAAAVAVEAVSDLVGIEIPLHELAGGCGAHRGRGAGDDGVEHPADRSARGPRRSRPDGGMITAERARERSIQPRRVMHL